jgi:hypothetical protein
MKSPSKGCLMAALLVLVAFAINVPAFADTYHTADFSGGIFGGDANVQAPFRGNGFEPMGPVSGNFVFDDQLIPAGSGFVNVFFSTFPASGIISAATKFTIRLGTTPLTFTLAEAMNGSGAIQYNNGHFNGFFYQTDFLFQGNQYRLDIQGGVWNIQQLINNVPSFHNLVSGYINIGDNNLTNLHPFVPSVIVPEIWLLLLGSDTSN